MLIAPPLQGYHLALANTSQEPGRVDCGPDSLSLSLDWSSHAVFLHPSYAKSVRDLFTLVG